MEIFFKFYNSFYMEHFHVIKVNYFNMVSYFFITL